MQKLDYAEIDEQNKEFILEFFDSPIAAIYRTGSTVTGKTVRDSDVDYLVLKDSEEHSIAGYVFRREHLATRTGIDYVLFTRADLHFPSKITLNRDDKISYLMREIERKRLLIHGEDVFDDWLDDDELRKIANTLKIGPDTISKIKQAVDWA